MLGEILDGAVATFLGSPIIAIGGVGRAGHSGWTLHDGQRCRRDALQRYEHQQGHRSKFSEEVKHALILEQGHGLSNDFGGWQAGACAEPLCCGTVVVPLWGKRFQASTGSTYSSRSAMVDSAAHRFATLPVGVPASAQPRWVSLSQIATARSATPPSAR